MRRYCDEWIQDWCQENGWTDLFQECQQYWAFPPGAVMPVPIPTQVLQLIKAERGLSDDEKTWLLGACVGTLLAGILVLVLRSPMPLVMIFAGWAILVAQLDEATPIRPVQRSEETSRVIPL